MIHRDLKPANVLIASDKQGLDVKISDFGLGKFLHDEMSPPRRDRRISSAHRATWRTDKPAAGQRKSVPPLTSTPWARYALRIADRKAAVLRLLSDGNTAATHHERTDFGSPVRRAPHNLATICDKCLNIEVTAMPLLPNCARPGALSRRRARFGTAKPARQSTHGAGAAAIPRGPLLLVPWRSYFRGLPRIVLVHGHGSSAARPNRASRAVQRLANKSASAAYGTPTWPR